MIILPEAGQTLARAETTAHILGKPKPETMIVHHQEQIEKAKTENHNIFADYTSGFGKQSHTYTFQAKLKKDTIKQNAGYQLNNAQMPLHAIRNQERKKVVIIHQRGHAEMTNQKIHKTFADASTQFRSKSPSHIDSFDYKL